MKHFFLLLCSMALLFQACTQTPEKEAKAYLEYATIWYQNAPEQRALYYQGFNMASYWIQEFAKQKGSRELAVVVDIDETMLDNSPFEAQMIRYNLPYSDSLWYAWTSRGTAKALPGAVAFSQLCDSLGVELFYISNRSVDELEVTMRNLQTLGFAFVGTDNMLFKENESSKKSRRDKVSEQFEIVMLIGDNLNDFSEAFEQKGDDWGVAIVEQYRNEFGKRFIILPNPMYGEWEKQLYGPENLTLKQRADLRMQALEGF